MDYGSKLNLNTLLFNHHKHTVLIPTFVIAVLLFILYFSANTYIYNLIKSSSIEKVKTHGHDMLLEKSKYIGNTLGEVSRLSQILQKEHKHFFANPELTYLPYGTPIFKVAHNGVYYKSNKTGSSLYYSSDTKITDKEKNKALRSEAMDISFKNIVESNPNIVAAYFNSWDNMNRIYPYIDNVYNLFGLSIQIPDYNFYYLADAKHNPKRESVWTGAYLDPAGNGWMVSCIAPIYNKDFLEGVTGIDITLESFINNILESKMPWNATLFMLDDKGSILAMPKKIEKIVKIEELIYHEYTTNINRTIEKPEEYNLIKNKNTPFSYKFAEYYKNKTKIFELTVNSIDYILLQTTVKETGWRLILIIEKNSIFHDIYKLKSYADIIGYSAIVFAILFYLAFLLYTVKRSESFALRITNPIRELSRQTTFVGTDKMTEPFVKSNIEEIDKLNSNFTKMVSELKIGKNNLIKTERRRQIYEEKAHIYHKKSLTDPLTGVYNRSKAEDVMSHEINLAKLYGQPLSLIMLDIDHFKEINDTLGHAVGDEVLVEFIKVINNNSRSNDIVIRNGGDEFLIICPNTEAKDAALHAENIRSLIESNNYKKDYNVTSSIGVTSYQTGDTKEAIFKRVDKALYIAKEKGRNCVVSS
ncbi:diguanylate cyclase (GGDEF domain) [Sulfurimonas gotlandica GD1]|uniref:diguanylate cyclase n=1 Tax=Sulfurimonas gotlandica (strain DSM 19862 / JCM 16533 / GD1) TaxID=929558 RepID=B6BIH5_SULGG|nr:diguanylate cyclase [Sulfurimonas gotlandica]EDZ63756.1 cache sensor signal transduction histidine kinase [Sulfurimonas gotlandica GD1]EHP30330.1 diguanylate cyclase (GGDEF domain) [Sulfurimonas gotlandica GD1]